MKSIKLFSAVYLLIFPGFVYSESDHVKTKAILDYQEAKGFKLSQTARETLRIRVEKWSGENPLRVSTGTLVFSQDQVGIYREREHWFKLVWVKIITKNKLEATISVEDLKNGDGIVRSGVPLLRVADLDAAGGTLIGEDDA